MKLWGKHIAPLPIKNQANHFLMIFFYRIDLKDSNFPENLVRVFIGQAVDMARTCVEAPLRRKPKYVKPDLKAELLSF